MPWGYKRDGTKTIPPNRKGIPLSSEHKRKIGLANRGRVVSEDTKKKISLAKTGVKLKKDHYNKIIKNLGTGKSHWNWKGGISKLKIYKHHRTKKYLDWRVAVFKRDNWMCQTCGARSGAGKPIYLEPHHIKGWTEYRKLRFNIDNGITLCYSCHKLVHKKRK